MSYYLIWNWSLLYDCFKLVCFTFYSNCWRNILLWIFDNINIIFNIIKYYICIIVDVYPNKIIAHILTLYSIYLNSHYCCSVGTILLMWKFIIRFNCSLQCCICTEYVYTLLIIYYSIPLSNGHVIVRLHRSSYFVPHPSIPYAN